MKTQPRVSIVWFRQDLRLADNSALDAAHRSGGAILPAYIHAPDEEAPWAPGGSSRWWLHQSLDALATELSGVNSRLVIRKGPTLAALRALIKETGAGAVFWNRRYEPAILARDQIIMEALHADGILAESFEGALLREPWAIQNKSGKSFQVFTPFWKRFMEDAAPAAPLAAPASLGAPIKWPESVKLAELELEPRIKWAEAMRAAWRPAPPARRQA